MLQVLQAEGFHITARGLVRLRLELGLRQRISFHEIEEAD